MDTYNAHDNKQSTFLTEGFALRHALTELVRKDSKKINIEFYAVLRSYLDVEENN